MRIENLLIIVIGFLSLTVPLYLFSRDRKSSSNFVLVLLSIITGPLWAVSIAMFRQADSVETGLFWNRMIYLLAVFIGFAFYYFIKVFPKKKETGIC